MLRRALPVACLALVVVAVAPRAHAEGFGGAPEVGPSECVIQGDDGRWRACAEVLAEKDEERARRAEAREAAAAPSERPAEEPPREPEPPPRRVTQLEKDAVKAGIDPKLPLVALRIRMAELSEEIEILEWRGYGPGRRTELEDERARLKGVLEDSETVALGRLMRCARDNGTPIEVKRILMTPAGPVRLGLRQLLAQLPSADPPMCGRIFLLEQADVDKIARAHALYALLKTNPFGYHQLEERARTEEELQALEKWMANEGLAPLKGRPKD